RRAKVPRRFSSPPPRGSGLLATGRWEREAAAARRRPRSATGGVVLLRFSTGSVAAGSAFFPVLRSIGRGNFAITRPHPGVTGVGRNRAARRNVVREARGATIRVSGESLS